MIRYSMAAAMFALSSLAATAATAQDCSLTAENQQATAPIAYEPFEPLDGVGFVRVRVRNTGDSSCLAELYLAPAGGRPLLRANGRALEWRTDGRSAGGSGEGGAGEIGPFQARVAPGAAHEFEVRVLVPAGQVQPQGSYTGEVNLRVIAQGADVPLSAPVTTLAAEVPGRAQMALSGSSTRAARGMAPPAIDFGELQTGEVGRVFVHVWSNSSVRVTMSSDNRGRMLHVDNASLTPVAYTAAFDGQPISLQAPVTVQRTPPATAAGAAYELALTVGDVSGRFAGLYRDRITVSVEAN